MARGGWVVKFQQTAFSRFNCDWSGRIGQLIVGVGLHQLWPAIMRPYNVLRATGVLPRKNRKALNALLRASVDKQRENVSRNR